ncbi:MULTISPECIES: bifunctional ADP-dependent NAD(P)H-hydrate dehydratase/NAD(P)H-hydrate epimerase [unclassified Synechocystis]|uniref:bifunctional ADP-dependent NAD(P)H-hydrate dehydratase/NAD(P)H-hydrate epimerase n=1 Tax=unclassified Synechocystis TaxID=2640012 RepID=UPI0004D1116E|nr:MULTISPECIES: bifunctional ADP-dependent NAD(P)H-hydrate dehydratase/NAD(P)H-hydrate epimerase [unclassified Synechocystis]AIE73087.1 NAD(P)HX epimerase / NAD(P)HX dehydratase [Synechocystis sp. PCC 6714]MCT0254386.1 bifunctional ADP-dependent NAD(P)H-hydrate dehydratase/NAD(P)H-hydrate epimerase [Synechocystis sp. CS-94]
MTLTHQGLQAVVSAAQMQSIENWLFDRGMPVAALMEKAALHIANRLQVLYPLAKYPRIGVVVGPGHNGGDGLVVARELTLHGYHVKVFQSLEQLKPLTQNHTNYAKSLGIPWLDGVNALAHCDLIIDGLFGVGLTRPITGAIADLITTINILPIPIVSIDLPSGIHTDTGEILGVAVQAERSFCLGLWKRAHFQDRALPYLGQTELLNIGLPPQAIAEVLGHGWPLQVLSSDQGKEALFPRRPLVTHKYQQGHLLLICGSQQYAGGALLSCLGARATGVGMVTVAVPKSVTSLIHSQCPEMLVHGCLETHSGAIAGLGNLNLASYSAIALGPGLSLDVGPVVEEVLNVACPLILDADALNKVAQQKLLPLLAQRTAPTVLTPHGGEFKRLFPDLDQGDRLTAAQTGAVRSQTTVLLKGAKTIIADPTGPTWLIKDSTSALARGGSGDVLTGLMGGILAQPSDLPLVQRVAGVAWWHAQAGIFAAQQRTVLGVDAQHLAEYLLPTYRRWTAGESITDRPGLVPRCTRPFDG